MENPLVPCLAIVNGQPMASSLEVAEKFGKRHADVLRAIDNLEIPVDWRERNFALMFREVPGPNGATRQEPYIDMTRDGFSLLGMGFTGAEAMKWKLRYIAQFNQMEAELRAQEARPAAYQVPMEEYVQLLRRVGDLEALRANLIQDRYQAQIEAASRPFTLRRKWTRISPETREQIAQLYREGLKETQISEKTGVSTSSVNRILHQMAGD